jgi:hypothetical protein
MRIVIRAFVVFLTLLSAFVIWRAVGLTSSGQLMWFAAAPRSVALANGKAEEVLFHHCCQSRIWILTRRAGAERESYAIIPPFAKHEGYVWRCNGWTAPRLPFFPFIVYWSDAAFDCDSDRAILTGHRGQSAREIRFGENSVVFIAVDGSSLAIRLE